MNKIYKGDSEGFKSLTEGYLEYAVEVVTNRAFPELRDGLKPVNRRSLYAMYMNKDNKLTSSVTVVGQVMNYHPHSDQSVYDSLCRLVSQSEYLNMPLLEGNGNFSKVYLSDKPADKRYTEMKLAPLANEFFRDMEGCSYKLDEKGKGLEPEVLPVTFPYILVGGSNGMGVGVANNLPSFNFWDVLGLLEKGLTGEPFTEDDIIVPDFPTGGFIVNNRQEIANIMFTGKGKLKIRANVEINGKEINITEVPYGRIVNTMVKKLKGYDIKGVSSVFEATDNNSERSGNKITVICSSKRKVEEVLMQLYRLGIAQNTFSSNMTVINGNEPVIGGVFTLIRKWIEWRKSVIVKKYEKELEGLYKIRGELDYFIQLVQDIPKRDKFIDLMVNLSINVAKGYLKEIFPEITDNEIEFITSRRLSQFNNGGKYLERFETVVKQIDTNLDFIENPEKQIRLDIERLKAENAGKYQRKTKITTKDYKFSKIEDSEIEDESPCTYKVSSTTVTKVGIGEIFEGEGIKLIKGKGNDVLVGFDSLGRCVRLYGNDLSFNRPCDLAGYFGVGAVDNYFVPLLSQIDDGKYMLIYDDGHCSFFDAEEVKPGARKALIIKQGVPEEVGTKLRYIFPMEDVKEFMVVRQGNKLGIIDMNNVWVKGRLYRTELVETDQPFDSVEFMDKEELYQEIPNCVEYMSMLTEVDDVEDGNE